MFYILDNNKNVKIIDDISEWYQFFKNIDNRQVALDVVNNYRISTVFLGIEHGLGTSGKPLLFETMVFLEDSNLESDMQRYATWDEAEKGHKNLLSAICK